MMLWVFLDPEVGKIKKDKRRRFEGVAQGTRSHLAIVPKENNTAATMVSANVAGSGWSGESVQEASFRTTGRVQ
jgi:hypothetical protein